MKYLTQICKVRKKSKTYYAASRCLLTIVVMQVERQLEQRKAQRYLLTFRDELEMLQGDLPLMNKPKLLWKQINHLFVLGIRRVFILSREYVCRL